MDGSETPGEWLRERPLQLHPPLRLWIITGMPWGHWCWWADCLPQVHHGKDQFSDTLAAPRSSWPSPHSADVPSPWRPALSQLGHPLHGSGTFQVQRRCGSRQGFVGVLQCSNHTLADTARLKKPPGALQEVVRLSPTPAGFSRGSDTGRGERSHLCRAQQPQGAELAACKMCLMIRPGHLGSCGCCFCPGSDPAGQ